MRLGPGGSVAPAAALGDGMLVFSVATTMVPSEGCPQNLHHSD